MKNASQQSLAAKSFQNRRRDYDDVDLIMSAMLKIWWMMSNSLCFDSSLSRVGMPPSRVGSSQPYCISFSIWMRKNGIENEHNAIFAEGKFEIHEHKGFEFIYLPPSKTDMRKVPSSGIASGIETLQECSRIEMKNIEFEKLPHSRADSQNVTRRMQKNALEWWNAFTSPVALRPLLVPIPFNEKP